MDGRYPAPVDRCFFICLFHPQYVEQDFSEPVIFNIKLSHRQDASSSKKMGGYFSIQIPFQYIQIQWFKKSLRGQYHGWNTIQI